MSPGDVFGAVSLGIQTAQLFGTCVQRYENLLEAFNLESDLSLLQCRLEIEMQRFRLWGDTAKITSGMEVPACHVQTVLSALRCVDDLFNDRDPIIKKYEDDVQGPADAVSRRTRWILTDKKRLDSIVTNITSVNDSLLSLLNESHQRQAAQAFQELAIDVLGTENISRIQVLGAATASSYVDICALAGLKALKLAAESEDEMATVNDQFVDLQNLMPDNKWIDLPLGTLDMWDREVRLLDREPMVLEWRQLPTDADKKAAALSKMQWLSPFLFQTTNIASLRTLEYHGVALDVKGEHIATVFRYPETSVSTAMEPVSLYHMITRDTSERWLPSLNARFELALSLSKAVLQLHTCGWLHKSISSGNVLFFYPEDYSDSTKHTHVADSILGSPYLQGYGYARAESAGTYGAPAAFSESITTAQAARVYRHPSTFASGDKRIKFRTTYDLYSLGVVLLEIGLWASCSPSGSYHEPKQVRKSLVDKYLNGRLAHNVGTRYQEVVRTCLLGDFGSRGTKKNWLELEFMKRVIRNLEQCKV